MRSGDHLAQDPECAFHACGVDIRRLTLDLDVYLEQSIEKVGKGREGQPEQTAAFARARSSKRSA